MREKHEFGPVYGPDSKVLILGSFPSVKSREQRFYYGHPQNRFWKIIRAICDEEAMEAVISGAVPAVPETIEEKKKLILENGFALWDVIESCEITGSSDSSIRDVRVNDMAVILSACRIRKICCNGGTAFRLFKKYAEPVLMEQWGNICPGERFPEILQLPSTSPANAARSLKSLTAEWQEKIGNN